jgi:hypothetical protein
VQLQFTFFPLFGRVLIFCYYVKLIMTFVILRGLKYDVLAFEFESFQFE